MSEVSASGAGEATISDRRARRSSDVCVGRFAAIMRRARRLRQNKVAYELAAITGRSVRTAERWLSGELTPDGDATLALFLSDMGPAFLETKVAELSPERQEAFWREMGKAYERAELRRAQADLDRRKEAAGLT